MDTKYSKNERAGKIMGYRPTDAISIDEPCELGYHCPVCKYEAVVDEEYDERLNWSEYRTFIWCAVCNKDYPSVLCMPDVDRATEIYLDILEAFKQERT
jgi:hypothetical protein